MPRTRYAGGVPIEAKQLCRIATGTYAGDGTISNPITGIGFRPKYVRIWVHSNSEATIEIHETTDTFTVGLSTRVASAEVKTYDNRLISIDADGFTVDDDGSNFHPNNSTSTYDYLCLG